MTKISLNIFCVILTIVPLLFFLFLIEKFPLCSFIIFVTIGS